MMNLLVPAISLLGASSTKTSSSSSSITIILFIAVIATAAYFFFIRPRRLQQQRQRTQSRDFEVGDEILTVGGIVGRVIDIDDDRITLLTGDNDPLGEGSPTRIVVVKNAIARKMEPRVEYGDDAEEHGGGDGDSAPRDELPQGPGTQDAGEAHPEQTPGDHEA
jgi:preprotein translocase YajC subunit